MLKVVVIDGSRISRNMLTSVLINGGFDVIGDATPTSAGIASTIKMKPQIICLDIGVSDATALEKIDDLRSALPKTLLFLVSGQFDPDTVKTAAGRGVHGFIVKPFKAETVLKTIRNAVIKLARQHRQASSEASTASQQDADSLQDEN